VEDKYKYKHIYKRENTLPIVGLLEEIRGRGKKENDKE
jgi:hypothetical protein